MFTWIAPDALGSIPWNDAAPMAADGGLVGRSTAFDVSGSTRCGCGTLRCWLASEDSPVEAMSSDDSRDNPAEGCAVEFEADAVAEMVESPEVMAGELEASGVEDDITLFARLLTN